MLRTLTLALALLGALVALPSPAAACPADTCIDEIPVCLSLIPYACFTVKPDEIPDRILDMTAIDDFIRDLIGPCTCDPID